LQFDERIRDGRLDDLRVDHDMFELIENWSSPLYPELEIAE
jgi:hypothetical protein